MIASAEVVLAFAWAFGANGFLIERQLAGIEDLPLAWAAPLADHANIVFHAREDWSMAFYLPAVADPVSPADVPQEREQGEPRLVLFAPYYLAPDGLVDISRMPVDVAEYYFHALAEAALDLEIGGALHRRGAGKAPYAVYLKQRAAELMIDVPQTHRLAAYTSALADFGAHLLAIRNETWRAARRQTAAGSDICRHLEQPASLFGLWRRSLAGGSYTGGYYASNGGSPRWLRSRQMLDRSDKDRFLAELFGVAWSGDPEQDFEAMCPGRR